MDTSLPTSITTVSDRLDYHSQKDFSLQCSNPSDSIANADINLLVLRLSATLPYRSRRHSVQLINQIATAIRALASNSGLDSNIFDQLFEAVFDCWLSTELEANVIALLTLALNNLPESDRSLKLQSRAQQVFKAGLAPIQSVFNLRFLSKFPSISPSFLAKSCLTTENENLDLQATRIALRDLWLVSTDDGFTVELQLHLIASRLLTSSIAPLLLDYGLSEWLHRLCTYPSDFWVAIGLNLERLSNHTSDYVKSLARNCFLQLEIVTNPRFTYHRLSTLMDSFSLNSLGTDFHLPHIDVNQFWSRQSFASFLKEKQIATAKPLPQDLYVSYLNTIFQVNMPFDIDQSRGNAIEVAATLIRDKLRPLGTVANTLDDIAQRLNRASMNAVSNIAVSTFLYALHTLISGIQCQHPEILACFSSAIPFFLSKCFIYDGFLAKIQPHRLSLARANPCAIQRSILFLEFAKQDLGAIAVPLCWSLKGSFFLAKNISSVSTALSRNSDSVKDKSLSALIDGISFHSNQDFESALNCYFEAFASVESENASICFNGVIECIRTLQMWSAIPKMAKAMESACQQNFSISLQKLLLDSSFLLQCGRQDEAQILMDASWSALESNHEFFVDSILVKCQLWINRIRSVGLQAIPSRIIAEARQFLSRVIDSSYLCSSFVETQKILAYHQLLLRLLDPSKESFEFESSPAFQNLQMLSELFMLRPSQAILHRLLLEAKQTGNTGLVSRLLHQASSSPDDLLPELHHSILICSELTEDSLLKLWKLSESSNNQGITLSLIETLMHTPSDMLATLTENVSDPFDLMGRAFGHCRDTSAGIHYAKWCADQAGVLGEGWFDGGSNYTGTKHFVPVFKCSRERLKFLLEDTVKAFIHNEGDVGVAVNSLCDDVFNVLKEGTDLQPKMFFSILSSTLSLEIDWDLFASESTSLSEAIKLIARVPELLRRATHMVSDVLRQRYSYNSSLLLIRLLEIGYFASELQVPVHSWSRVIPQLQAMLCRLELPPVVHSRVRGILSQIARDTPNFESIAFPLSSEKIDNGLLEDLAKDLKLCNASLWTEVCTFSRHMSALSYFDDDRWLDLLSHLISEIPSRWRWWCEECDQGQDIADSYRVIMQSVLEAYENAWHELVLNWNREHKRLFIEKFGHQIQNIQLHLRLPMHATSCNLVDKKALLSAIVHQMKVLKHDISLLTKVDIRTICPEMVIHSNYSFRIPGMPAGSFPMTLANLSIEILRTKTRPRMLSFVGSDGITYSYLLKGKEDLNVDQRVLQVFDYVNELITKTPKKSFGLALTPTYSVTSISSEIGLISIVPGTISLFRLNRFGLGSDRESSGSQALDDHDHREAAGSTPAQLYLFHLHQLLEECQLSPKAPRSKWPPDLYHSLYDRLLSITDDSILEKRLYLSSLSPEQEFLKRVCYTSTSASSSMLGYLLGIGDRHLGNILLRLETGEVVHIDFAVSFNAGRSLRVPETVPFRLTPCLRKALGPFSLPSGQFSYNMELIFEICRKHQPYILTILRAMWNHPVEGWNSRRRHILKRDVDRAMVHRLIVARLQRSRSFLESLHIWALGNQSHWLPLVTAHNSWAAARNELSLKTAEVSVLRNRASAAEQAILLLPDLIEEQNLVKLKLSTASDLERLQLKDKLLEIQQRQDAARELIGSLPSFRKDLAVAQDALSTLQSKKQFLVAPALTPTDLEVMSTLQNLWGSIRSLLNRLPQDEFTIVQNLRHDWERLEEDIEAVRSPDSNLSPGTVINLIDGRKAFSSFFVTLRNFIKSDIAKLPSPDPRLKATSAIAEVSERLSSTQNDLVQDLIAQALDKDKLCRMFHGWAPWV